MDADLTAKIRRCLVQHRDVPAAYLFGSAGAGESVSNDVDILVLLREGADRFEAHTRLTRSLSDALGIPEDKIDLLFFDSREVNPHVLVRAINGGRLLKNTSPELLSRKIEEVSTYFLENEPVLLRAEILRRESMEAFVGS
jgi:predicted nucleotidyltransferase